MVNQDKIRWCITIPCLWSDHSKAVMQSAAERAGMVKGPQSPPREGSMHKLELALETQAALLGFLCTVRGYIDQVDM